MAGGLAQMPFRFDPEHWLDRAAEMRTIAASIPEDGIKASMLKLASDYDRLAARVGCARTSGDEAKRALASL